MLARKVPGPGKLQLSRRSAPQLLAARPGPCKTKNPYDAQKSANFSEKKRKVGPNLGPKTGTRNWSPGALAIKFLKEGQILDQFLVPVSGSKNRSQKSKKNRKISKRWIQFGHLYDIFEFGTAGSPIVGFSGDVLALRPRRWLRTCLPLL